VIQWELHFGHLACFCGERFRFMAFSIGIPHPRHWLPLCGRSPRQNLHGNDVPSSDSFIAIDPLAALLVAGQHPVDDIGMQLNHGQLNAQKPDAGFPAPG